MEVLPTGQDTSVPVMAPMLLELGPEVVELAL